MLQRALKMYFCNPDSDHFCFTKLSFAALSLAIGPMPSFKEKKMSHKHPASKHHHEAAEHHEKAAQHHREAALRR
jgi:hypothetical protein